MAKTIVILGNGFDLDVGLSTGYRDFVESDTFRDFWSVEPKDSPEVYNNDITRPIGLLQFVKLNSLIDRWVDLEMYLAKYAEEGRIKIAPKGHLLNVYNRSDVSIENMYKNLLESLKAYLQMISYDSIKLDSSAAKFLRNICTNRDVEIWTFNYTDLNKLCTHLGIDKIECSVIHVHGSLKEDDIILGFHNDANVDASYNYMKKMENPFHCFSGYTTKLEDADSIIIFGHSLGETDKDYFAEWFNWATYSNKMQNIVIYTKDEVSKKRIIERINIMTSNGFHKIKGRNNIIFYP
jgi:hypothetical protein